MFDNMFDNRYDAIYARQSVDKKESISTENQVKFAERQIFDDIKVKKFVDKGYSGKNIERPEFQKLLADIERGRVRRVIVYMLDRVSRSLLDFTNLMQLFKKHNVEFVSCSERFDTSTPVGRAMLSFLMVFAQYERETTQKRITDNYYERAKLGIYMGGSPPYGFDAKPYRVNGVKARILVPNENMAPLMEAAYRYVNENVSLNELVNELNEKGVKTLRGKSWHSEKLSKIFHNPAYVRADAAVYEYYKNLGACIQSDISDFIGVNGLLAYGRPKQGTSKWANIKDYNIVVAPHEGTMDSSTWLKIQVKLEKNRSFKGSGKSKLTWLSGLVKCGVCGYSMSPNRGSRKLPDGSYVMYLRCYNKINKGPCGAGSVRLLDVEKAVESQLFSFIQDIDTKLEQFESHEVNADVNELKISIAKKEKAIDNLLDSLASASGVTMEYINRKVSALDAELNSLKKRLNDALINDNDIDTEKIIEVKKLIENWNSLSVEDKKSVAYAFIQKIYVSKSKIEIIWNY